MDPGLHSGINASTPQNISRSRPRALSDGPQLRDTISPLAHNNWSFSNLNANEEQIDGTTTRAHHEMHPEVQAFQAFLRENVSYAFVHPSSTSARREFLSIKAIREYFEQNGSTRLRKLLLGVWYPDEPHVDPNDIMQNYIAVFCILVELGRGTLVEHFFFWDLSDMKLPFDPVQSPPAHFPIVSDNPRFFSAFCDMQWKYCVPEFKDPMMNIHFDAQRILPIVSKELIAGGGSGIMHNVGLDPPYNQSEQEMPVSNFLRGTAISNPLRLGSIGGIS